MLLLWELRAAAPVVDLRTSARRQVLLTNLASVAAGFAMYTMNLLGQQILQLPAATGFGLGQSMLRARLWADPGGLVMMAMAPVAARLRAARGPKASLLAGAVIMSCANGLGEVLMGSTWRVLAITVVLSAGVGFAYAAMPSMIMEAVPLSETAAANGLNALARSLGTSISSAVIGVSRPEGRPGWTGRSTRRQRGRRTRRPLPPCPASLWGVRLRQTPHSRTGAGTSGLHGKPPSPGAATPGCRFLLLSPEGWTAQKAGGSAGVITEMALTWRSTDGTPPMIMLIPMTPANDSGHRTRRREG